MRTRRTQRGFTLLEVVVALAVLALSLMAIFNLNSGAVAMHVYTKRLTVATMLARSKMTDIEQGLYDKGFNTSDEEKSGDFSQEGWSSFKWRAKIIAPKTTGVSPSQFMGALLGMPLGTDALSSLFGGGAADAKGSSASASSSTGAPTPSAAGGAGALAGMGGLVQGQFSQMLDQLAQSVREVRLTISWREGTRSDSIDLVTHVVALGPGGDRNGVPGTALNATGAAGTTGLPGLPNQVPGASAINPGFPQLPSTSGTTFGQTGKGQ